MLNRSRELGVTLLELIVGIAILSALLMIGLPSFGLWIQNTQVRTAAESVQNGLQVARSEAVRRNANVRFTLSNANGRVEWTVGCVVERDTCPAVIQTRNASEGGVNGRVGVSTEIPPAVVPATQYSTALAAGEGLGDAGGAGVTFSSLGMMANPAADVHRIDVINSSTADARRLVIIIGSGGLTRMCDPRLSLAENPQGCS